MGRRHRRKKSTKPKVSVVTSATQLEASQKPQIIATKFSDLAGNICDHDCGGCKQPHGCSNFLKGMFCGAAAVSDIAKEAGYTATAGPALGYCCLGHCHIGLYAIIHSTSVTPKLREVYQMPQRKTRDCCVHTWCGGCARAQELRFIHKAKELQLAAAMAGQATVQVGPKLAAAMTGQSKVQVGPARQSMSDKLKGSSDKL